ncbi:Hypothetical protein PHPALM_845 [Phytophthora palmivora]|uniref:Uncharacterized protein n=1 Tax=Phytophthora palmivora TaxID=4796 RepID=A0A2P4YTU6_9STRA|nr:Hypothetical protein PHPALM_845 [Phytophthora palmivora]
MGFKRETRVEWLKYWTSKPVQERPKVIMIQETHITSEAEAVELEREWQRLWGQKHDQRLTYWSIGSTKSGGVAVLVAPEVASTIQPWQQHLWTNRQLGILAGDHAILNIYAPVDPPAARETFFKKMKQWKLGQHTKVIRGQAK